MIYTVTFNPSLDYVISVADFETGKINRTSSEAIFAGGKGINVSWVLSELGVKSTALGFVSGFTGNELECRVQSKGIQTDFIHVKEGFTRINVKCRTDKQMDNEEISHEETEINGQGPIVSEEELAQLMNKISCMTEEDILIISGSVCGGLSKNIYADIVKICKEKAIRVVVDASSVLLWNTLEYHPFLIKPNQYELGDIFNREITTREEIIFYGKELQNRGAQNVLVSAGGDGAVLIAEDGAVYEMEAPKGVVINSVGAGDSMVAGFIAGYMNNGDYEKALKLGVCAGSATAFSEGLACKEDIILLTK